MIWVAALLIAAHMVHLHTFWNGAMVVLVADSMRIAVLVVINQLPVAVVQ